MIPAESNDGKILGPRHGPRGDRGARTVGEENVPVEEGSGRTSQRRGLERRRTRGTRSRRTTNTNRHTSLGFHPRGPHPSPVVTPHNCPLAPFPHHPRHHRLCR